MKKNEIYKKILILAGLLILNSACTNSTLKPKDESTEGGSGNNNGGGGNNNASCTEPVSGQVIQSGQSLTLYLNNLVGCGQTCANSANAVSITCNNGVITSPGNTLGASSLTCVEPSVASCTVDPLDSLTFLNLDVVDNLEQDLINYLNAKTITDENNNTVTLSTLERNLILSYDPSAPTFSVKFKFITTDPITTLTSDINNFNYLDGRLEVDNFRYLMEFDFPSRKVYVDSEANPVFQISTFTQWLSITIPGFPQPVATGINAVRVDVKNSNTEISINTKINQTNSAIEDSDIRVIFKPDPTRFLTVLRLRGASSSSGALVNLCPYVDESVLENMCQ